MNIYDMAASVPWAITTDALETILAIAARDDLPSHALEALKGRPLDNTRAVSVRNGVAIIPINGALVRHGDMFSDVSGAVSVNTLALDFTAALNDRSIDAILLSIDSPGGEINGMNELVNMIQAGRAVKPIEAYISHLGCSAAYWIASAARTITADATAQIGSIGVVAAVPNPEKDSGRHVEFVSSQSPHKRPNIATEGGRAQIQARIDALADVFVASVARNRGVSQAKVLADFGAGGVLVGEAAQKAGLIDHIGSFEASLAQLAAGTHTAAFDAAQQKETIVADETTKRTSRLLSWLGGGEDSAFAAIPDPDPSLHLAPGAAFRGPVDDPRVKELEARLKASEERQFTSDAAHFVEDLVRGSQALPAEAADLRDLYLQAARDDAAAGESVRVTKLTTTLGKRVPHGLTGERLKGQFAVVPNVLTTPARGSAADEDELAADEEEARRFAKNRNRAAK